MSEEIPDNKKLLRLTDHYLVDLECLREMYSSVVPFLKEKDKERSEIAKRILEGATVEGDKSEVAGESENNEETRSIEFKPGDIEIFMTTISKLRRAELLFEKQVTVTLVSRFDEFLGELLRLVLEQNPSWLISSEKTITYKELIELKSIEKAIEGVIQKEVENLLRGSHEDQIAYIDEKMKLGISDNFDKLPDFLEVAERRNLFVHTGGVVSQQYIDKCNAFGCKLDGIKCGDSLGSQGDYFEEAVYVYFEAGLRIAQAAYRRLFPNELKAADSALNRLAIKFMNAGEYKISKIVTEFDINIPQKLRSDDDENIYYALINRAISLKFSGQDFEVGIQDIPWKAFHPKYALCLHVLREEFCEAAEMMKSDEIKSSIGVEGFRAWPVFREFRESDEFKQSYSELYGESYVPDIEKDAEIKAKQENSEIIEES